MTPEARAELTVMLVMRLHALDQGGEKEQKYGHKQIAQMIAGGVNELFQLGTHLGVLARNPFGLTVEPGYPGDAEPEEAQQ